MKKITSVNIYTQPAFDAIYQLDHDSIGTPNYMGVAYFWNVEYKHYLRDATVAQCRRVHNKFLQAGLPLDGKSDAHHAIIFDVLKIS